MRIAYDARTDSLYIDLASRPSADSLEVSPGFVIDYNAEGNVVGVDIDNASRKLELHELTLTKLAFGNRPAGR